MCVRIFNYHFGVVQDTFPQACLLFPCHISKFSSSKSNMNVSLRISLSQVSFLLGVPVGCFSVYQSCYVHTHSDGVAREIISPTNILLCKIV
ncbi:unnamed protein product [Moneuplotes crassus]|uniref:Uncharacterized protein n=1 Tax=Euplotes crassus TaxID=5936 RepID=A0AAD1X5X0_EUPCR|nr:unnamed protein product [Moneuplotes crassus]